MGINLAAIKAKIAQLNGDNKRENSSNIQFWKPAVGEYKIRCMHWPDGVCKEGEVFEERWFYYGIGRSALLAPDQFGNPDPIKELRMKLFSSGTPRDKEQAKKLFPKMRSYAPIVVLEGHDADPEKVLVYSFGSGIYQKLLGYFMNEKVGDYFDPFNGFNLDVKVTQVKNKEFLDVSIELAALDGRCPLNSDPEKVKTILASIPDLSKVWQVKDYDLISKDLDAWLGTAGQAAATPSVGTVKEAVESKSSLDELDDLVAEVKEEKKSAAKKVEKPVAVAKAAKKEPVVVDDEDSPATDDLDAAFKDLMES